MSKNLRLKCVSYMTPLSHNDSQRVMPLSNISNYIRRGNLIINELYRSTSQHNSPHGKAFALTKKPKISLTKSNNMYHYTQTNPKNEKIKVNSYVNKAKVAHHSPSQSLSSMNNIKVFYNELSKRVGSRKCNDSSSYNSSNNSNLYTGMKQLSTKDNSITLNKFVSHTAKNSLCSNTEGFSVKDINDIDTPEELHFFYVNVLQNGKKVERKFEGDEGDGSK